jgi:transcriptional regulator with XRE-family HTH domain
MGKNYRRIKEVQFIAAVLHAFKSSGLSDKELAAEVGVSRSAVTNIRHWRYPGPVIQEKLMHWLNMEMKDILFHGYYLLSRNESPPADPQKTIADLKDRISKIKTF